MHISVFDISVSDWNTGNKIIMQSVYSILYQLFPEYSLVTLPYIEPFGKITTKNIKKSKFLFFGGGNVLTSNTENLYWGITDENICAINNTILLGVGWWKYQDRPTKEMSEILLSTLSGHFYHSVRDSYTKQMLAKAGIENVLVTGCPTLWQLSPEHLADIPKKKADHVLFTFTSDYSKNYQRDLTILNILKNSYKQLYFWPQGPEDCDYIKKFTFNGSTLPANLPALEKFLEENDRVDYVGTRLHAGIVALQKKKRTLIVSIDNRAWEMKKDFNLPVISDSELDDLYDRIHKDVQSEIELPYKNIFLWKRQFIGF